MEDNIVISNTAGDILNDFAGMAEIDRLSLIERTEKFKLKLASEKRAKVIGSLQSIYGEDRVRDLDVNVDMDTSKVSSDTFRDVAERIKETNSLVQQMHNAF